MILKACKNCGVAKALSEFSKIGRVTGGRPSRGGHGVAATCKHCKAEKRKPGIHEERAAKAAVVAAGLKRCGGCKEHLPFSAFSVCRSAGDGLNFKCRECNAKYAAEWRETRPDAFRQWAAKHSDRLHANNKAWREQNKDQVKASYAKWARENKGRINALIAKRYAAKKRAAPSWANQDAIKAFYAEAIRLTKETGVKHEVDHYYPLQGKLVCGLHCEANLQILTEFENISKSNRMPEEYYEARRNRSSRSGHGASGARVRVKRDGAPEPEGSGHGRSVEPAC